jgi:hypothetical protein
MAEMQEPARAVATPVVKRQRIGEKFVGAIVKIEQRDQTKVDPDGTRRPKLKSNGKAAQELVVHCLAMESTAMVSIGDDIHLPTEGEPVRVILKGKAFGEWIDARKKHRNGKLHHGDVIIQKVTVAQQYDANGQPKGGEIVDQKVADGVPRGTSLGFYGPIEIHEWKDAKWAELCEQAALASEAAPAVAGGPFDDEEPF